MKVSELIAKLNHYPQDADIMVEYPSGDYWNTQLARPIDEIGEVRVERSEYHRTFKIIENYDQESEDSKTVYVI